MSMTDGEWQRHLTSQQEHEWGSNAEDLETQEETSCDIYKSNNFIKYKSL